MIQYFFIRFHDYEMGNIPDAEIFFYYYKTSIKASIHVGSDLL